MANTNPPSISASHEETAPSAPVQSAQTNLSTGGDASIPPTDAPSTTANPHTSWSASDDLDAPDSNDLDGTDDTDSAIGASDGESYTTSLVESVYNYVYENGRRYHAFREGEYPLPNDERELDRMDMQHHIYLMLFGGDIYRAPLPKTVDRVLDIGCGTGIWAIDFADHHPEATVIANDLSVIQPTWVPPNVQFVIDDAEQDWQYSRPFDYIHIRSMGGSIGDWPRLLKQAYDNLKPGGWIEVMDFETWASTDDNSLPETSSYHEFQVRLTEAAEMFGKKMNIAPHFKKLVADAGYSNVAEEAKKVPLMPWPRNRKHKEIGKYMYVQMMDSIEAYSLALFTRVLKWDTARVQTLLAGVRQDLKNMDYHMYSVVHCVYGQKPES